MTSEAKKAMSADTSGSAPDQCMATVRAATTRTDEDQILDLKSAAGLLGFSTSHLSKILSGKFPNLPVLRHVRAGRTVRIRRGALLDWFYQAENRRQGSGAR
jgi:hypothetical protein